MTRVVVSIVLVANHLLMRSRIASLAGVFLYQFVFFGSASAGIGVMALYCGGLSSHYVHGVSIVLLVQAAMVPAPWRRAMAGLLLDAAPYPAVVLAAAGFEARARGVQPSHEALAYFGLDFTFVLATAIMGSIASTVLWSARRQVYEARKLGRYRLKVRVGAGGMGEVWMAWDDSGRRDVALKALVASATDQAGAVARFEREARAAASLTSRHTVRVFDYGASDDGVRYLAMELLYGRNLADIVVREGPMPPSRAVHLIRQACESLREAHSRGIVHRDIKPENLFVTTEQGERDFLKVVDFGIAKVSSQADDATLTQPGWVGGTPAYMAPEVCAGLPADPRSDLYSLGAVLFYVLTGSPPFEGANAGALMAAHVNQTPAAPSSRRSSIDPALDRVVLRCLAKQASARFQSAQELETALADCGVASWVPEDSRPILRPRSLRK